MLYSVPIFGSAFVGKTLDFWQYLSAFNFILLVHQSILVFSWYEMLETPEVKNFAQKIGDKGVRWIVVTITVLTGIAFSASVNMEGYMRNVFLIEFVMACTTLAVFLFSKKLSINHRYRWVGELIFWLPGLLIFSLDVAQYF